MSLLGIDEVGRGPWAGPLVIGAVVLDDPDAEWCQELTDSKKLSKKKREKLNQIILDKALATGLGWVSAAELDEIGLGPALKLATRRAVDAAVKNGARFDSILIDGTNNFLEGTKYAEITSVKPKADLLIKEVSAASIIAKVARDNYMAELATKYPEYGFEKHVGYGTNLHREALAQHGPCSEHRFSFKPIKEVDGCFCEEYKRSTTGESRSDFPRVTLEKKRPATSLLGQKAEGIVARCLERKGHEIVARNYKTKFYEIDIISICNHNIYFTEVKYRKNTNCGTPLESITPAKQKQMRFAAEAFLHCHPKLEQQYSPILSVAALSGSNFHLDDWFVLDG